MVHLITGRFTQRQQAQQAQEQLLAAGFSADQISQSPAEPDRSDQSTSPADADVSGLQSFVASLTGERAPVTFIPDESNTESATPIQISIQAKSDAQAGQAEALLKQAGAVIIA